MLQVKGLGRCPGKMGVKVQICKIFHNRPLEQPVKKPSESYIIFGFFERWFFKPASLDHETVGLDHSTEGGYPGG